MNWENLKVFLALAYEGTTRGASDRLGMASTTVMRRIASFEQQMGTRLFDRLPSGYKLTIDGQELLEKAALIEEKMYDIERDLVGKDSRREGLLRVSISQGLFNYLLLPVFDDFSTKHPEILLDINLSNQFVDITRLETDVAIRLTDNPKAHLSDSLVGRKLIDFDKSIYCSKSISENKEEALPWVAWDKQVDFLKWVNESPYPDAPIRYIVNDMAGIAHAVRSGMGISYLPCFIAERIEGLRETAKAKKSHAFECWVLTHRDLHKATKVKLFLNSVSEYFKSNIKK